MYDIKPISDEYSADGSDMKKNKSERKKTEFDKREMAWVGFWSGIGATVLASITCAIWDSYLTHIESETQKAAMPFEVLSDKTGDHPIEEPWKKQGISIFDKRIPEGATSTPTPSP